MKNRILLFGLLVLLWISFPVSADWHIENVTNGWGASGSGDYIYSESGKTCFIVMDNDSINRPELMVYCRTGENTYSTESVLENASKVIDYALTMDSTGSWGMCYIWNQTDVYYRKQGGSNELLKNCPTRINKCDVMYDNSDIPHVAWGGKSALNKPYLNESIYISGNWIMKTIPIYTDTYYNVQEISILWDYATNHKFALTTTVYDTHEFFSFSVGNSYDSDWSLIRYKEAGVIDIQPTTDATILSNGSVDMMFATTGYTNISIMKNITSVFTTIKQVGSDAYEGGIDYFSDDYHYTYKDSSSNLKYGSSSSESTVTGSIKAVPDLVSDNSGYIYIAYSGNDNIFHIAYSKPQYSISGRVIDAVTLEPIVTLPTIKLDNGTYTAICDIDGYFSFSNVEAGTYSYAISEDGYVTQTGTIVVDSDITNWNTALYPESYSENLTSYTFFFINSDNIAQSNVSIKLEYVDGCPCLIGNEYYRTTDSDGKISGYLMKGTYRLSNPFHLINYEQYIDIDIYSPISKTFILMSVNGTWNASFQIYDYETNDWLSGASVVLYSDSYYYSGSTDLEGKISFNAISDTYYLSIMKSGYYSYPCDMAYLGDYGVTQEWSAEGEETECYKKIDLSANYSEIIALVPTSYLKYNLSIAVLDCTNASMPYISGIALYLEGKGTIVYLENKTSVNGYVTFFNLTAGDYKYWFVDSTGEYQQEYPDFKYPITLYSDTTLTECMLKTSAIQTYNLTLNEQNQTSGITCQLMDSDGMYYNQIKITNTTGSIQFSGLREYWDYDLRCAKNGYYDYTTYISVYQTNIIHNFTMQKAIPVYTMSGTVYYAGTTTAIPNVKVEINASKNNIQYSDSQGYFSFSGLENGKYSIQLTKEGFFNYSSEFEIKNQDVVIPYELTSLNELYKFTICTTDNQSNPLKDTTITIDNSELEITQYLSTGQDGCVQFVEPKAVYQITAEKEGYLSFKTEKTVSADNQKWIFILQKKEIEEFEFGETDFFGMIADYGWSILALVFGLFVTAIIVQEIRVIRGK